MSIKLIQGDCLEAMRKMEANSIDAIATDPPAGISFMGKDWDGAKGGRQSWIAWLAEIMAEAFRVAKPGSYALVWAFPRTSHWTATAMEDAGWEVCDRISHIFGSGFPKHKSKLKPAVEDWWLCREPAKGATMLNIDACRVQGPDTEWTRENGKTKRPPTSQTCYAQDKWTKNWISTPKKTEGGSQGRWPAHLILDDFAAAELDRQSGEGENSHRPNRKPTLKMGYAGASNEFLTAGFNDQGGASRFFTRLPIEAEDLVPFKYQAKASKADRNSGNTHPTVKSTDLMRWLCRLITPENGTILDCFMGSGSTGKAATLEGFNFIGIERDPEYFAIAKRRITALKRPRVPASRPSSRDSQE